MRIVGIILLVLGLGGIGVGGYGMQILSEANEVIDTNTDQLRTEFPELDAVADLTSVEDLVAIDGILKDSGDYANQDLAWDILLAMSDVDEGTLMRDIGFGAGGALLLIGAILIALGGRKKKAAA